MRLFTTSKDIGWSRWLDVNRLVKAHKESEHNFEVNNQPTRSGLNKKQLRARYISKQQLIDISHLITEEYYYNVLVGRCTVNLIPKELFLNTIYGSKKMNLKCLSIRKMCRWGTLIFARILFVMTFLYNREHCYYQLIFLTIICQRNATNDQQGCV